MAWHESGGPRRKDPVAGALRLTCLHSLVLEKGSVRQGRLCRGGMVMGLGIRQAGKAPVTPGAGGGGRPRLLGPLEPGTRVVWRYTSL